MLGGTARELGAVEVKSSIATFAFSTKEADKVGTNGVSLSVAATLFEGDSSVLLSPSERLRFPFPFPLISFCKSSQSNLTDLGTQPNISCPPAFEKVTI